MSISNSAESLPLFTDLQTGGRIVTFGNGDVIYDVATNAQYVYYIRSGAVQLYVSGPDNAAHLQIIYGPGEWFGIGAVAGNARHEMRAVATAGTVLREISITDFRAALDRDPQQAAEVIRQIAQRLRDSIMETARLVFEDSNQRLLHVLLRFSESAVSTRHPEGVAIHLTHEQLAQAVGVARETVSLALSQFRQQNLLRTGRNQLIFNPDVLRKFIQARSKEAMMPQTDPQIEPG